MSANSWTLLRLKSLSLTVPCFSDLMNPPIEKWCCVIWEAKIKRTQLRPHLSLWLLTYLPTYLPTYTGISSHPSLETLANYVSYLSHYAGQTTWRHHTDRQRCSRNANGSSPSSLSVPSSNRQMPECKTLPMIPAPAFHPCWLMPDGTEVSQPH